jgi:hypothetical protein
VDCDSRWQTPGQRTGLGEFVSGSFTVCPVPSQPSQPLIAARLLPDATNGMQSLAMSDAGQLASPGLASRGSGAADPSALEQSNASQSFGRATVASTNRSHARPPWSAVRAAESTLKRTAGERFGCGPCPLVAGRWWCGGASGSGAVVSAPAGVWTWTELVAAIGPRIVLTERTRAEACWRVGKDAPLWRR